MQIHFHTAFFFTTQSPAPILDLSALKNHLNNESSYYHISQLFVILTKQVSRPLQVLSPATEAGARKRDSSEYFIGGNERWVGLLCI
jgi:hypothetical protein